MAVLFRAVFWGKVLKISDKTSDHYKRTHTHTKTKTHTTLGIKMEQVRMVIMRRRVFIKRFWISLLFSFSFLSFAFKVRFYSNFLSLYVYVMMMMTID